jgi:NACalpha-BTF3-like transcription factor
LFKGTSTLFTRDLEERGMKDIQATVGTIDTGKPIDTRVSVGEGMRSGTFVGQSKISANIDYFYNTLQTPKVDAADRPVLDADGNQVYTVAAGQQDTINMINQQAQTLLDNGFEGSLDQAIGNVIEKMNNQDYDLPLLTTAVEGSPIDVKITNAYNEAKNQNNTTFMQELIDMLKERGLVSKADNLQQELDDFITQKTDEPEPETETTTTTTQPTEDVPGTKVERQGKGAKIVTEDYISPEQKDINSKVEVTEEFIKQVMEKNNVNRNKAIDILKMYGYIKFPQTEKTKSPPFLKGKK